MQFAYRGRTKTGKMERGLIEAPSAIEATRRLAGRGLTVSAIKPAGLGHGWLHVSRAVSLRDRTLFTEELALILGAGIPLARALEDLHEQTPNRRLRATLAGVAADIQGGLSFSDALAKHPQIFPDLMVAVIRSGEASGKLVDVLDRLRFQMEKDAELRGKIKSALIYPAILTVGIIGVLILILVFVIPQLEGIFADVGITLPLITRILLGTTDFLVSWGVWLGGVLVLLMGALFLIVRQSSVAFYLDRWKLKLPIFGPLSQKVAVARLATTSTTLLTAGLPILETLKIGQSVVGNRFYQRELARVAKAAETGASLAATIRSGRIFPVMLANLLAVGEESGNLAETFAAAAKYYDREIEATTRNLTSLLEPFLMLSMGAGIAFVIAAVLLPIYKLVESI